MKILFLSLISVFTLCAESLNEYKKRTAHERTLYEKALSDSYSAYTAKQRAELTSWQKKRQRALAAFQVGIRKRWGEVEEQTNTVWVEYDSTGSSVSSVNFESGTLTVSLLITDTAASESLLVDAVHRVMESSGSDGALPVAGDGDPVTEKPVLYKQLHLEPHEVEKLVQNEKREEKTASGKKKMVIRLPLVPNHLQIRVKSVLPLVKLYCRQHNVSVSHVLATIHTESAFNPMARSSVGAVGLMQLMPQYGGREAYRFLKGTDRIPSDVYLYDSEQNIELGTAYVRILENHFFSGVSDRDARRYCVIAAYNTGAGNVAKAFISKGSLRSAVSRINMLTTQQVYQQLLKKLPYLETREYLEKVEKRRLLYSKL